MTGSESALPDANVWLALFLAKHAAHGAARRWLNSRGGAPLILCRVTQMAFLRHLTTAAIMGPNVLTQAAAWREYERLLARDEVVFLAEPNGLEIRWRDYSQQRLPATKRWTDAYLAAFAQGHGLQLVTFDRGFTQYEGTEVLVLTEAS
jgi:toxin-antitoxin system PIN domain toxin